MFESGKSAWIAWFGIRMFFSTMGILSVRGRVVFEPCTPYKQSSELNQLHSGKLT